MMVQDAKVRNYLVETTKQCINVICFMSSMLFSIFYSHNERSVFVRKPHKSSVLSATLI